MKNKGSQEEWCPSASLSSVHTSIPAPERLHAMNTYPPLFQQFNGFGQGIADLPALPDTSNWSQPHPVPCPGPHPVAPSISAFPAVPDTSNSPANSPVPCAVPSPQAEESKAIVRITSSPRPQPDIEDRLIAEFHDQTRPWNIDLPQLLINLGQKLIEHEQADKWLTMPQVSEFCRRYRINWKRQTTKAKDLQRFGMEYFRSHTDIMGGGVKVEYRTEWNENKTREILFLQFRKLYGDGHCH